jgi:peptide/nickel transport system substrate-binding protein
LKTATGSPAGDSRWKKERKEEGKIGTMEEWNDGMLRWRVETTSSRERRRKMRKGMKGFLGIAGMIALAVIFSTQGFAADKVLKVGTSEDIRDMDAHRTTGHYEPEIKDAVFDRMVTIKPGTWEIVPGIATSWEYSKDHKEITFRIKKGIKFQKGYGELTAEDVKFSMERLTTPKWEVEVRPNSLDRIEVIDKYTVKVYLKFADSSFVATQLAKQSIGRVLPKATATMSVAEVRKGPIGSGPYELETWQPMEKIVLKRFKDYHGKAPYYDRIEYLVFANPETLELALEKGDIDMGIISYKAIPRFRTLKTMKVYMGPAAGYAWVGLNATKKPFDDIRVRKAIRQAIDVEEILVGAFEDAPKQARSMFPPELPGFWKEAPLYKSDIKKAKQMLAEAGFPNGLAATMIVSPANRGDLVIPILIEQLKQIGITITPTSVTRPAQIAGLQAATYDMYYIEYRGFARDPFEATRWFSCEEVHPKGWNMSKWCNKEFDELRKKALGTMDEKDQVSLYVRMQKIMDEEVPAVWIHNGLTAIAYKANINLDGKVNPDGRAVIGELTAR